MTIKLTFENCYQGVLRQLLLREERGCGCGGIRGVVGIALYTGAREDDGMCVEKLKEKRISHGGKCVAKLQ